MISFNIGDKVAIKDLHEIKKKVLEATNSKIVGEIISQKSIIIITKMDNLL